MRKPKRKKLIRAYLEKQLEKYSRRIQAISEAAYNIRCIIEQMDADAKPLEQPLEVPAKINEEKINAPVEK